MFSLSWKSSPVFFGGSLFLSGLMTFALFADVVVVGYYTSWNKSVYPADKINFENVTHINHAFAWPESNGSISMYRDIPDISLVEQTHGAGKKILISFGGWGNCAGFSPMTADTSARGNFIRNVVDFILTYAYDGIDLDWEYPGSTIEKNNLNVLVAELRREFDRIDSTLLITMAVPAGNWSGQWFDFGTLENHVDWFGVMTYDFHGSWSNHAGHNSPLYAPVNDACGSVHTGIQYLTVTRAIPKEKVLAGLPFYGREFEASQIYGSSAGSLNEYQYAEVVPKIGNGWAYHWDDLSKVPYLTSTTQTKLISYDDSMSLRHKCIYAKQKNLRGVMIWALGQDVIGEDQILLTAVGTSMGLVTSLAQDKADLPEDYLVLYNYPNPFNNRTVISYTVPYNTRIDLTVYNLIGEKVITLVDEFKSAGNHQLEWETHNLVSGLYIGRLRAGNLMLMEKFVLLR